jgi:glucose-6-phosphate 1-dehydrogenase
LTDGFSEEQIFRIDHYLGKEMVQNLLVLRFANQFFEPLWNSKYIEKVELLWTEDLGVYGRGKYFDNYGIIRDVMQNHLLQILALIGMEEPGSLTADAIRDRKVELLENVKPVVPGGVQIGQYTGAVYKGVNVSGYRDEPSIPENSLTPTFARIKLKIDNDRWRDTRFVMTAGKGMRESKAEVRIKFRKKSGGIFCDFGKCPEPNELIIRIQPNEGFHFKITTKAPDGKLDFAVKDLDLSYHRVFNNPVLPEAYENLLLDVMSGNKELFIRDDELGASWDILMPVLNYLKLQKLVPEPYPFGSCGPKPFFKEADCPCEKK